MKKINIKKLAVLIMGMVMCLVLVSCSKPTISEYLKDNESALSQAESKNEQVEISAKDDSLVYTYTFKDDSVQADDDTKATIDAQLEKKKDSFNDIYTQVSKEVKTLKSVIVEYCTVDGDEITSMSFKG